MMRKRQHWTWGFIVVFITCWCLGLGVPPIAQAGDAESVQVSSDDVPAEWLTEVERSTFRRTPRHEETIAYCRRLAEHSKWVHYQPYGASPLGRDMPLVIVSSDGAFSPEAAKATGKQIVLIQAGIHAGEISGKDAMLMLLRDIAVTRTRAKLLDNVILLMVPIFNVDGHERFSAYSRINQNGPDEMGWRVTSRNLNLNRDYMKADSVEMRAMLKLWNEWQPHLYFDLHTTDGGDWQYDLCCAVETHQAAPQAISNWNENTLLPYIIPALKRDGHIPSTYFDLVDSKDPAKGIRSGGFSPRFSTSYTALRNRPAILVETHMLKPYRTRVIGQYNIVLHTIEMLNENPLLLPDVVRQAEAEAVHIGEAYRESFQLPIRVKRTDEGTPITFKGFAYRRELSSISGTVRIIYDNTKPIDLETQWFKTLEVTQSVNPPPAYIIPPQWTEVIKRLQIHGLRTRRLSKPVTLKVQSYRFEEVTFPSKPFEGRFEPRFKTVPLTEERTYPTGSVVVELNQPGARLAVFLLEPDAPDSLVAWGFFNSIFEQKEYAEDYILEELARSMLKEHPELRAEFEEKVATDKDFAVNPQTRLYFFYQRSPYWDQTFNVYPVGRLVDEAALQALDRVTPMRRESEPRPRGRGK